VLLSLGDQSVKGVEQVRKVLLGLGKDALEVKLIREGKPRRMSLVGPEHGFPPESAEYWMGTPVSTVDGTLRAHLPSLSADVGLIVNDVVKDSPADKAAVKTNDILVAMDGKPLKNPDALIAQIQASKGKAVPLQVLRAGKPLTVTITPAKRAHPTVINFRQNPDLQVLYRVVQPDMAIQIDPQAPRDPAAKGQVQEPLVMPPLAATFNWANPYYGNLAYNPTGLYVYSSPGVADSPTAKIEGQLKEVLAKLDGITKALEALKKPAEK
jgi:membrane-associated protease RseP (regulator of RpoE activity)